jgi:O-antigen/teichoic acid export membrane protein
VLTLLTGTTVALTISYFVQPVLTRFFEPEAFGLLDALIAVVGLVAPFASFRYEDAIVLPKTDKQAANVLVLAGAILFFTTGASGLVVVWRNSIAGWFNTPDLAPWLILVPVILFSMRLSQLVEMWLSRQRSFRDVSVGQVARSSTMGATRLISAATGFGVGANPLGLIAGLLVGYAVSAVFFVVKIWRDFRNVIRAAVTWDGITSSARRYQRFPRFAMLSSGLGALVTRLPFLLLLYFFDNEVVGFFGRAFGVVAIPLSVAGTAVSQVFFVQAAEQVHRGSIATLSAGVHRRLVTLVVFPTLAVVVAGPELFRTVFGTGWVEAGHFARIIGRVSHDTTFRRPRATTAGTRHWHDHVRRANSSAGSGGPYRQCDERVDCAFVRGLWSSRTTIGRHDESGSNDMDTNVRSVRSLRLLCFARFGLAHTR